MGRPRRLNVFTTCTVLPLASLLGCLSSENTVSDGGALDARPATEDASAPFLEASPGDTGIAASSNDTGVDTSTVAVPDATDDALATDATTAPEASTDAAPACGTGTGTVDQAQLIDPDGGGQYSNTQVSLGQTFTAGTSGVLTGIELSAGICPTMPVPTGAAWRLTVSVAGGAVLGSADLAISALPKTCTPGSLSAVPPGPAYWDLSSQCIRVSSGTRYSFSLTATWQAPSCTTSVCVGGQNAGSTCASPTQCVDIEPAVAINATGGYAGGNALYNGGAQTIDLVFRTYTR